MTILSVRDATNGFAHDAAEVTEQYVAVLLIAIERQTEMSRMQGVRLDLRSVVADSLRQKVEMPRLHRRHSAIVIRIARRRYN